MTTVNICYFREEEYLKREDLFRRNAFLIILKMVELAPEEGGPAHPSVLVDEVRLMMTVMNVWNVLFFHSVFSAHKASLTHKTQNLSVNVFSLHRFFTASSFWGRSTTPNIRQKIFWSMTTCLISWRAVTLNLLSSFPHDYPRGLHFHVCSTWWVCRSSKANTMFLTHSIKLLVC